MPKPTLYADFNNADADGRLRLNGAGTLRDLARLGLELSDGLSVTVHDEELAADGEVVRSASESIWTVHVDWTQVRPWSRERVPAHMAI